MNIKWNWLKHYYEFLLLMIFLLFILAVSSIINQYTIKNKNFIINEKLYPVYTSSFYCPKCGTLFTSNNYIKKIPNININDIFYTYNKCNICGFEWLSTPKYTNNYIVYLNKDIKNEK